MREIDHFVKNELARFQGSYDRFTFQDLGTVVDSARKMGFFSMNLPEEQGGVGRAIVPLCQILERVCAVDSGLGVLIFSQAIAQDIVFLASARTERDWLAFPIFEDPEEPSLRYHQEGDRYWIEGDCKEVVWGEKGGVFSASSAQDPKRVSFFLVHGGKASSSRNTLGLKTLPLADKSFGRVSAELLGKEGQPLWKQVATRMDVALAACYLGVMRGAWTEAKAYSETRKQGGRKIIDWSEHRLRLAELKLRLEAAELLVEAASARVDSGQPDAAVKSFAVAAQLRDWVADFTSASLQSMGGAGYMKDYGQEKAFRDAHQLMALLGMGSYRKLRSLGDE